MIIKKKLIIIALLLLSIAGLKAQGVAIGDAEFTADESAILDIVSSDKGLLIPRITLVNSTSAAPVSSPAEGLLIYNTATTGDVVVGFYVWNGSKWSRVITEDGDDPRWGGEPNQTSEIGRTGSVGIGTTEPPVKLSVREDGENLPLSLHKYSTNTGDFTGMLFKVYGSIYNNYHKGGIFFERTGNRGVGNLHFATTTSTLSTNVGIADSRMTILSNGKVGIGTQTPNSALNIIVTNVKS